MKITVILCTYNRCQELPKALESLASSTFTVPAEWEVLVVDNNSTDETRTVVEAFCQRHPCRFRYVFEKRQGKSYALNAGIQEARGEILAFVDDDVTVEPTWLQSLTAPLNNGNCVGTAGRIILQWPTLLPAWLSTEGPLARYPFPNFDLGHEAKDLFRPPFGTNMAFRKAMFEKHGGFRVDLGPSPSRGVPCPHEDTEFGHRLLQAGECLRYEPSAVVYHPVRRERISQKYFLDWWFDEGRASIRAYGARPRTKWRVVGIPLYLLRSLALWTVRWVVAVNPRKRFYLKLVVWGKVGAISEFYLYNLSEKQQSGQS